MSMTRQQRSAAVWSSFCLLLGAFLVVWFVSHGPGNYQNVETPVSAESRPAATTANLIDTVPNNVYTFTPAHQGEVSEEDQIDNLLRNLSEKYRILDI